MAAPSSATSSHDAAYDRAAQAIANADAVLITAGAGLGVDSGLPDFRGVNGFWRAKHLQLRFEEMSTPSWFAKDPEFAWGFWGHRISLYRDAQPHEGYTLLRELAEAKELPYFVFTSNVDGHFLRAGFDPDRLVECHGSTQFMQCTKNCKHELWSSDSVNVAFSEETFRTTSPDQVPKCQFCGAVARPNVLMFGDYGFDWQRVHTQEANFASWKQAVKGKRVVVVEIGCGKYVPTVRHQSEEIISTHGTVFSTLVRINPRDSDIPASCYDLDSAAVDEEQGEDESWPERPHVSLAVGGLEALQAIATKVASTSSS